jgi:hypothetical protein
LLEVGWLESTPKQLDSASALFHIFQGYPVKEIASYMDGVVAEAVEQPIP